jgi:hypothetical protein
MIFALAFACSSRSEPVRPPDDAGEAVPSVPSPASARLDRAEFNRRAAEHAAQVFWVADADGSGTPDPSEVVWTWGPSPWRVWDAPTLASEMDRWATWTDAPAESARLTAVRRELAVGRPTLVLTEVSVDEQPFVDAMIEVGHALDRLHALQLGVAGVALADDGPSRALGFRNQVPWCVQSGLADDVNCRATAEPVPHEVGVYDRELQTPGFCAALEAAGVMDPFSAVTAGPKAVPYPEAWPAEMAVARQALERAADLLPDAEAPQRDYLRAAAAAFASNDWFAADAAWVKVTADNSRWAIRVGPDETYWEPCDRKAGFHLMFARIDSGAAEWKRALEPRRDALEAAMAAKAGPPYAPREVRFQLPEFVAIVLNAGDSRSPTGATSGQSLPNWGPVAESGGRTVAMSNLDSDPDSTAAKRSQAASLLCELGPYTDDPLPLRYSTVLHEVAHNLGPASGYRVDGKTDEQIFGGELATLLEELKAQTAALWLTDVLQRDGVITAEFAHQAHQADLVWLLGQVAQGLTDAQGGWSTYPQLSAIQLGLLIEAGALRWDPTRTAADGRETGCLVVDPVALPAAIDGMAGVVFGIKARGDRAAAEVLHAQHVGGADHTLHGLIAERWRRVAAPSFVYGFRRATLRGVEGN